MRFFLNVWLVPRNVAIGFLIVYRKLVSPLYGNVCRYYPSCSSYGLQQFQQRGFVISVVLTLWRILRCNPFTPGGVDEVKPGNGNVVITKHGFVMAKGFSVRKAN